MTIARTLLRVLGTLALAATLGGCAAGQARSPQVDFDASEYPRVFDAARLALRDNGFEIDRVDAAAGVITTRPKPTAGLATFWDPEQSSLVQEWEDLANHQRRRVTISFEPRAAIPLEPARDQAASGPPPEDRRESTGPMIARVQVVMERVNRPGWRLDPTSVRAASTTRDPALDPRRMQPAFDVPTTQDPHLAGRIATMIQRRWERGE